MGGGEWDLLQLLTNGDVCTDERFINLQQPTTFPGGVYPVATQVSQEAAFNCHHQHRIKTASLIHIQPPPGNGSSHIFNCYQFQPSLTVVHTPAQSGKCVIYRGADEMLQKGYTAPIQSEIKLGCLSLNYFNVMFLVSVVVAGQMWMTK